MRIEFKRGFALISAVIFIVVIATIGMLALSFSTKSARQATDVYLKEQAEVLARSATEFAIMAMQAHDYTQNCLENITIFYPQKANPMFRINVDLYYFDSSLTNCNNIISNNSLNSIAGSGMAEHPSSRTALIDVTVTGNDPIQPIRYTLQSVQKP